jgi:hypothetical protein
MTAQVIFLSNFYYPDEQKRAELEFYQEQMDLYQAELEMLSRDFNEFQKYVFKQNSHNNIRRSWRLILGDNDQD